MINNQHTRYGSGGSSSSSNSSSSIVVVIVVVVVGTASVVWWSEFLATDTEVPGSIPGATRFSE